MSPHAVLAGAGLLLALLGPPALSLLARRSHADPLGMPTRLLVWALALVVMAVVLSLPDGLAQLEWRRIDAFTGLHAAAGTVLTLCCGPLAALVQRRLGAASVLQSGQLQAVLALPAGRRLFIAVTAGVVEELLYRGYGMGIGQHLLGSLGAATALSLGIFTAAHLRWGWGHLVAVLLAGAVLSGLYALTQDLPACMVAHALVDVVGLFGARRALRGRKLAQGAAGAVQSV